MSGSSDPRAAYVDDGVLSSGFLGWGFDTVPTDEAPPPMSMPHHGGHHHHHYPRAQPHRPQPHPYPMNPGIASGSGHYAVPPSQSRHRGPSGHIQDPGRHASGSKHYSHHHHQVPSSGMHSGIPFTSTIVPPPPAVRPPVGIGGGSGGPSGSVNNQAARRSGGMPSLPGSSQSSTCQYCGKSYSRPDYLSTHIAGKFRYWNRFWVCGITVEHL